MSKEATDGWIDDWMDDCKLLHVRCRTQSVSMYGTDVTDQLRHSNHSLIGQLCVCERLL